MSRPIALALCLTWTLWCLARLAPPSPALSPEGVVALAGQVQTITCDDLDRCRLRLTPALADAHPIEGRVVLLTDGDAGEKIP